MLVDGILSFEATCSTMPLRSPGKRETWTFRSCRRLTISLMPRSGVGGALLWAFTSAPWRARWELSVLWGQPWKALPHPRLAVSVLTEHPQLHRIWLAYQFHRLWWLRYPHQSVLHSWTEKLPQLWMGDHSWKNFPRFSRAGFLGNDTLLFLLLSWIKMQHQVLTTNFFMRDLVSSATAGAFVLPLPTPAPQALAAATSELQGAEVWLREVQSQSPREVTCADLQSFYQTITWSLLISEVASGRFCMCFPKLQLHRFLSLGWITPICKPIAGALKTQEYSICVVLKTAVGLTKLVL